MKIFNWVHRRFAHKDGFSQNVKKADPDDIFTKDGDRQALLDNVVHLADFLDGWQGGVLTIGTFGLGSLMEDVLKQENDDHEYYCKEEEALFGVDDDDDDDDVYNEEGEELNPLAVMNRVVEEGSKCDSAVVFPGGMITNGTPVDGGRRDENDIAAGDHSDEYSNKWDRHYNNMMKKKKKKERITLADLFSAELVDGISVNSKNRKLVQSAGGALMSKKKLRQPDAAKQMFPKRLIPAAAGVKHDSRPLKKLNQLMKKMLKRKIHPDAEANYKEDYQSSSTSGIIPSDNESVSLLRSSRYEM